MQGKVPEKNKIMLEETKNRKGLLRIVFQGFGQCEWFRWQVCSLHVVGHDSNTVFKLCRLQPATTETWEAAESSFHLLGFN